MESMHFQGVSNKGQAANCEESLKNVKVPDPPILYFLLGKSSFPSLGNISIYN